MSEEYDEICEKVDRIELKKEIPIIPVVDQSPKELLDKFEIVNEEPTDTVLPEKYVSLLKCSCGLRYNIIFYTVSNKFDFIPLPDGELTSLEKQALDEEQGFKGEYEKRKDEKKRVMKLIK